MVNYDSDSSEGGDYTETNVLLGYVSRDPSEDTISRLGGRPEWLDPANPPSAKLARCSVCQDLMVLLLQLNGELPEEFPGHERRLYVFACKRSTCRRKIGSVKALRGIRISKEAALREQNILAQKEKQKIEAQAKKDEEQKRKAEAPKLGDALFGGKSSGAGSLGANPFSSNANPFATTSANPFSTGSTPAPNPFAKKPDSTPPPTAEDKAVSTLPKTFAETLSLNTEPKPKVTPEQIVFEPWPQESSQPEPYPPLYLVDVDYETLDPNPPAIPSQARVEMDMEVDESSANSAKEEREAFESTMDESFQKFADRMAQNPEQVVRYEFRGQPLLYSTVDPVGAVLSSGRPIPRCKACGGARVFEVQLTPHAITELEAEELGLEGMDWGTVIVGVCEKDCQVRGVEAGEAGYLEEWVGVQWEELLQ